VVLVAGTALLSLGLQLRFLLGSDLAQLATTWVPDDAYYYLQTAWNCGVSGTFTFDGSNATYGFQPLWMLLLSGLAAALPSKLALLRASLALGALLHVATGVLLWHWLVRADRRRAALLAAVLWLLNPFLIHLCASGMESALHALLLVSLLLLYDSVEPGRIRPGIALALGALCGLLVLSRVNAALLPLVLLADLGLRGRQDWRAQSRALLLMGLGALLVLGPWMGFATLELGGPIPTSGLRRLIGGPAGLARFGCNTLGFLPETWFRLPLGDMERGLFDARALPPPSFTSLWRYGVQAAIGWALGFWVPRQHALRDWLLVPGLLVAMALGFMALRAQVRSRDPQALARSAQRVQSAAPRGFWLVCAWALLSMGINGLLLSPYVVYAYWYRVPEVLALVAGVALLLPRIPLPSWRPGTLRRGLYAYGGLLALLSLASMAAQLAPQSWREEDGAVAKASWDTIDWMNQNLDPGSLVGSWNAGIFGFFADGPVVVNLDGLANSAQYLEEVVREETLYRLALTEDNATLRYLEREEIALLVELQPIASLEKEPFAGVIPAERYELVQQSEPVAYPGQPPDTHAVVLVRVKEPVELPLDGGVNGTAALEELPQAD